MGPGDDADLLHRIRNGDPEAVAAVVDRYYPSLLNFAHRLGCSREDAEDVAQETLLKAARGLERYEHRERFRSWLFRIAANAVRDHLKKASVRREVVSDVERLADRAAGGPSPEEVAVLDSVGRAVRTAVAALPEPQRICLILRYYHGFSIEEIATVVLCRRGTVKSRLHAALRTLKEALAEVDEE
ncbi:MAG: RNA polymerase sigma factor [Ignavibacteriales bacterium]